MANRFPLVVDTSDGNKFKELPDGDNLILTNSSIINALNMSAVGYVQASRFIINNTDFTGSYTELTNTPTIPAAITDLVTDGTDGQILITNGSGLVTFQDIPAQDPTLGGALSGTASAAVINANSISVTELNVDEGTIGQVLATDGAGNLQFVDAGSGAGGGGATNFFGLSGEIGLSQINDDFITPAKLKDGGQTPTAGQYLTIAAGGDFEYLDLPAGGVVSYNDLTNKPTIPTTLTDLGIAEGSNNNFLTTDGNGQYTFVNIDTIENLEFSGTQISTTLDNTNISISPNGNGYLQVTGTNAIIVPAGTTAQRNPNTAGALRLNTEIGIFEGYDGTNWGSLGGVRSVDGLTFIKAEATPGASDDKLYFNTNGQQSATLDSALLDFNQNVRLKIRNTSTALDFDTGALSVDGGVSIRGNLVVSGSIDVDETFDTSAVVASTAATGTLTNSLTVPSADMPYFKVGQKIRVFGASADATEQTNINMGVSATAVGFATPDGSGDEVTFSYRVAQFDFTTGKISESVGPATVEIEQAGLLTFNNSSNIQLVLARQSTNHGILLYRKIGAEANFSLIKVLGPKELSTALSSISYTDYYDFDLVDWSNKTSGNTFNEASGVVHMPLTAPTTSKLGWFDTEIDAIDLVNNRVETTTSFYAEATNTVVIDDTVLIQAKIDAAKTQNRNSYTLENRTYFIKQLSIPSGFTLAGQGDQTRIRKQYWSTDITTGSNAMITVDTETYATQENISVKNLRLDGSHVNQYLAQDTTSAYLNYAIRIFGNDILFENVELDNVIGGGIYAYNDVFSENLTVLNCEITNGGLTYSYDYSPLYASEARSVKIAHNTFRNYSDAVYVDAVSKGIVTPNVIDNCGAGLFAYGATKVVLSPNVLLGPANEFLQNPDVFNSEYDSVNIQIEANVDFNSPNYTYQESGVLFDFTANQGVLTPIINELIKTNNVEELDTDYSNTLSNNPYIQFTHSTEDLESGNFRFRIQQLNVNDLLQRANYATLFAANANSQGLIYRIVHTEYVPQNTIVGAGVQSPGGDYSVIVSSTTGLTAGDIVRLVGHQTTPSVSGVNGTITTINTQNNTVGIDFGSTLGDIQEPTGVGGSIALQNNFVVTKGKIN